MENRVFQLIHIEPNILTSTLLQFIYCFANLVEGEGVADIDICGKKIKK